VKNGSLFDWVNGSRRRPGPKTTTMIVDGKHADISIAGEQPKGGRLQEGSPKRKPRKAGHGGRGWGWGGEGVGVGGKMVGHGKSRVVWSWQRDAYARGGPKGKWRPLFKQPRHKDNAAG